MNLKFSLKVLLSKTGGYYIPLAVIFTQFLSIPGLLLGIIFIQLNAQFSYETLKVISSSIPELIFGTSLILLVFTWLVTPHARTALSIHRLGSTPTNNKEQLLAWKEITSFNWNYSFANFTTILLAGVLPFITYHYFNRNINIEQLVYVSIGGAASAIIVVSFSSLLLENILSSARNILIPNDEDDIIQNNGGKSITTKMMLFSAAIIGIINLTLVTAGYKNTISALKSGQSVDVIISNLKFELIFVSILSLLIGLGLAYLSTRVLTDPLESLVKNLKRGKLDSAADKLKISTTDNISELTIYINRMAAETKELKMLMEKKAAEQIVQLKAAYNIGNAASSSQDPAQLVENIVNLITDQLGYYYSAIFLLDDTQNFAELKAATGEAGKVLQKNKHKVSMNGKSLVSESLSKDKVVVSSDSEYSFSLIPNPLLPYTKSEIAIPLKSGDRILGVLNVQSTQENSFGAQEKETLQAIAGHTAVTLENARLYHEVQENLRELRAIQQQYLTNAWTNLTSGQDIEYIVGEDEPTINHSVDIPLSLRDQVLGKIHIQTENSWSLEERNLVNAIATQATIAIENARLINESRQLASREQLAAEISNKIWTSATIDGVLQIVAKDLGRALDADKLVIEIAPDRKGDNE